ncbi:TetR/AcrR family transcriptional regulator [Phenylobacterium sp.]|uniref:TetR/AcrR family transcriptional regulator n=1 Tax=Phenylobacterium sp. TaxID=1871053 RepID=UPI0035AF06A5
MAEQKRRTPRQARAVSTVDVICDAAFQLLEAEGAERLTTNRVAARAGVSVGTIYQYFRDKHDILAALAERRGEAARESVVELVIHRREEGTLRRIVSEIGDSFRDAPRPPRAPGRRGGGLLRRHQAFLAAIDGKAGHRLGLTPERAFVLTHTPLCLLRAAAAEPELGLDPARLEDELTRLLEAYLTALAGEAGQAPAAAEDRDADRGLAQSAGIIE